MTSATQRAPRRTPNPLPERTWHRIQDAHLKGQASISKLSKDYKVAVGSVHAHVSERSKRLRAVANQVFESDQQLAKLPADEKVAVMDLVADLRATSEHLAGAAKLGAMTARRMAAMAATHANKVGARDAQSGRPSTDAENGQNLERVMAYSKAANEAASLGLELIQATRGHDLPTKPVEAPKRLPADKGDAIKAYQEFASGGATA